CTFISVLAGQIVQRVLALALDIQAERRKRVTTATLNEVVRAAVASHRVSQRGKPLRIYYTTQAETAPPTFIFFVNDPALVHFSYRRYLENQLREAFGFSGTAIRVVFRGRKEE